MKIKTMAKALIVGTILLMVYIFIGNSFAEFYFGGKKEMLQTASLINNLCNESGFCPLMLEGWEGENGRLKKGRMLYLANPDPKNENNETSIKPQSFRLIYVMSFPQDDWFEVQGGVGQKVASGWTGR